MPSFSSSAFIRIASQEHALRLNITHNLVHGSPSDRVHSVKRRLPKDLDVLWLSDITVSLSGSLDAHQIPAHDIACSGLARHLHAQLKTNADRLGLNNVSRPFIDDADGLPKLALTPSRPLPRSSRPHAILVSLHLDYIWRSVSMGTDGGSSRLLEEAGPFSPTLFLPTEALLNRVTEQLLINHLVGRYPLIFGPWCQKLDLEMQYFPSIARSIVQVMSRSENNRFLSKCKRLFKAARTQHKFALQACAAALSACTDDDTVGTPEEEVEDLYSMPVLTDEQILCENLEQLFRMGVSRRRFKPAATPQLVSLPQDEDDILLQSTPDEGVVDEASWVELTETETSPCALLTEDVDLIIQEDRFEDAMWHLHDVHEGDTSLENFAPSESIMCRSQSDESLIDASISLARITTRCQQACSFTLYHHPNVDGLELDPAASGLHDKFSLEEPGASALLANQTDSLAHDHCFSEGDEQVTQETESFGVLDIDIWSEGGEDSDSILFEVEVEDPDGTDGSLDWLV